MTQADKVQTATSLYQAGDIFEAEQLFGEVLLQDNDNFPALKFLGKIMLERGNYARAADILSKALKVNARSPTAHLDLGVALEELHRPLEALASFDSAIALNPNIALAYYNRGSVLRSLQRPDEALASYDRAIALQPDFLAAHANRAAVLEVCGRLEEALAGYDRAIALQPDFDLFYNRGNCLWRLKRPEDALASFDSAIALKPGFAQAHANRAVALQVLKRLDDSLASFDEAIALNPELASAYYNRGNSLKDLKRLDDAIASFDRTIALDPDHASALTNRSYCAMLKGDLERGLPDYEYRQSNKPNGFDPAKRLTAETLGAIRGKTLLLRYEIGLGDTIQYCRYVPFLVARGAKVLLSAQKPLRGLMESLDAPVTLVDHNDLALGYDYWVSIMSLDYVFRREAENVNKVPYLRADPERHERWKTRLGTEGFKIGVCWETAGRAEFFGKSFSPSEFAAISQLPVRLLGITRSDFRAELGRGGPAIEYLGPEFDAGPDAFLDSAAVMKCCDLVITSDTATAHLAGALACPTWMALKYVPDCRWRLDRSDTPLYPTMRIFRQAAHDDWGSAFRPMETELAAMLRQKPN